VSQEGPPQLRARTAGGPCPVPPPRHDHHKFLIIMRDFFIRLDIRQAAMSTILHDRLCRPRRMLPAQDSPIRLLLSTHQAARRRRPDNAPPLGPHGSTLVYARNHSLANSPPPIPDPETLSPIIPLAKLPLFTPRSSCVHARAAGGGLHGTMCSPPPCSTTWRQPPPYHRSASDQGSASPLARQRRNRMKKHAQVQHELSK